MNALDLYTAARRLFPDAVAVSVGHSVHTAGNGEPRTTWTVNIWDGPICETSGITHTGYGNTMEEAIKNIRAIEK